MSYSITSTKDTIITRDLLIDDNISYSLIDDEFTIPNFYRWKDVCKSQELNWRVHTFDLTQESIILEKKQLSKFYHAIAQVSCSTQSHTYYQVLESSTYHHIYLYRFRENDTYIVQYPSPCSRKYERVIGYVQLSHLANLQVLVKGKIQNIGYSVLGFTPTQVVIDLYIDVNNTELINIQAPESSKQGEIRTMLDYIDDKCLLMLNPAYSLLTPVTREIILDENFDEEDMQHMYNIIEREGSIKYLCELLASQHVDITELLQTQSISEVVSFIKEHCSYDFVHECFCDHAEEEERDYVTVDYTVTLTDGPFCVEKIMSAYKELDFENNNYHKVRAFDLLPSEVVLLKETKGKKAQTLYHLRRRERLEYDTFTAEELYLLRYNDNSYDVMKSDHVYSYDKDNTLYPCLLSLSQVETLVNKEIAYRILGFIQDRILCVLDKEDEGVMYTQIPDKILRNALMCKCLII